MTDVTAKLAAWIEEAVEYVNSETRSPSLEREGRALLAAYEAAQAEPVAWMYQAKRSDGSTHGPYLCWKPTHIDAMSAVMGVQPTPLFAAPVAQAEPWHDIETAPKDGRKLLLFYLNTQGNARRVVGCWLTDEQAAESDTDDVGLEAGWYERIDNWPDYTQVAIHEGEPSHWMPLPQPPKESQP